MSAGGLASASGPRVRLRRRFAETWFASPLYAVTLGGGRAPKIEPLTVDLWPGDAEKGAALAGGAYRFAGQTHAVDGADWRPKDAAPGWIASLHRFDWLRDLHALGGEGARRTAQALVRSWIETQRRWDPIVWRPDVASARLSSWLTHAEFVGGGDPALASMFAKAALRQARHLRRALASTEGAERLLALRSLILASLVISREARRTEKLLALLEDEVEAQINADGGHVERSPRLHFAVLQALVETRAALRERSARTPFVLQEAIDRAAPMLRFWRHGDGGLALFNDTDEGEPWLMDVVLARAESRGKPLTEAAQTGFQRIAANRTLVLMDTGAPPPRGLDLHAHAGTLSFELSAGRERIVTNCGAYVGAGEDWRSAQRKTAAHSTATIDELDSSELQVGGGIGRRPPHVTCARSEAAGNVWIEASHDGFVRKAGITHRRRIYLAGSGGDLRGEDTFEGDSIRRFTLRFHLHPSVKASVIQDGSAVLLRLGSGAGWRMRVSGAVAKIAESVYLGGRGEARRTEQVVVDGRTDGGETQVKWALTRLSNRD